MLKLKVPYLAAGHEMTCGLLMVVLRAVQEEKKKANRDFLLCQAFSAYKDQEERSVIAVLPKYS